MADEPQITLTESPLPAQPTEQARDKGPINPIKKSTSKLVWVIFGIVILLLIAGGTAAYYIYNSQSKSQSNNTPTPTPTPSLQASSSPKVTPVALEGGTTYSSQRLGISFSYATLSEDAPISIKEVGNKIYVYSNETVSSYQNGQYVEVLNKQPADSITQAIASNILANYSPDNCHVSQMSQSTDLPDSYQVATIKYDPSNWDGTYSPNPDLCPSPYMTTNGISYFVMDTQHPGKLLYISIGQYGIMASSSPNHKLPWQDTIRILDN